MHIASVGTALPKHVYSQDELIAALRGQWGARHHNLDRLEALHRHACVGSRHLALPLEAYAQLDSFTRANAAFIDVALELGEQAIRRALDRAGLQPRDVDHVFFTTVTGLAVPSIEARLQNRVEFRRDLKRTPLFGLGCVAGAAAIARAADYLRGHPHDVALVLAVELCSLTLQRGDLSLANIVASGLFGDGAAAVVLTGDPADGPEILATRSVFYPNSEDAMGWRIGTHGFEVVLSADVPALIERNIGGDVDAFLKAQGLRRADIASWVCHPGGPKVLQAMQAALGLSDEALAVTWRSLATVGNLSSASVLMVLNDTLTEHRPRAGTPGLLLAMGPGFVSELVLLGW